MYILTPGSVATKTMVVSRLVDAWLPTTCHNYLASFHKFAVFMRAWNLVLCPPFDFPHDALL